MLRTSQIWRRMSIQAVRNRLRQRGIRPRRPSVGSVVTQVRRSARVRWCHTSRVWHLSFEFRSAISHVFFSKDVMEEPAYTGRRNERFALACVQKVDICGGGNVTMWAAISYNRRTNLVFVQCNLAAQRCKDMLCSHNCPRLLPYWENNSAGKCQTP